MKTRDDVIEYQKTLDDAGTLSKDIDLVDPVSAIALEFQGTNGATSNKNNWLSDVITKVEIVDGGKPLYSVNLHQLEALHFYKTGQTPTLFPSEWLSGTQRHACLLLFGRRLWDPEYAMDFTKYRNPQLKITSNIAAIRAAGATGFVSESLKATIVAKSMENAVPPAKYLKAEQIDSFTSAGSGDKRVNLPIDHPYRMLLFRLWLDEYDTNEIVSDLKLVADVTKYTLLERKVQQLDAMALAQFGQIMYKHDFLRSGSINFRVAANKEPSAYLAVQNPGVYDIITIWAQWSSNIYIELATHAGALDSTDRKLTGQVRGHAIHATLPVPFGDMDRPESWFDPTPHTKFEAVLTQGTADAVCQVVAEQEAPVG